MILWCDGEGTQSAAAGALRNHSIGNYVEGWSSLTGRSSIDGLEYAGRDLRRRCDILENGKAVRRFRHDRKAKAALRAWLCEPRLLLVQIVRLILCMPTARTYSDKPRALEFKVYDYIFYNRASANGPLFGVLVVGVHVPIFERFEAGPEADLIVPCRVVRVRPPGEMQETGQRLEVMSHTSEDQLELFVVARSPEPNSLHALIDCHDHSPNPGLDGNFCCALEPFYMQIACRRKRLANARGHHQTVLRRAGLMLSFPPASEKLANYAASNRGLIALSCDQEVVRSAAAAVLRDHNVGNYLSR